MSARIRMGVALSDVGRSERRGGPAIEPTRGKLDAFCAALSERAGVTVTAYAAPRYDRLLKRLKLAEVELCWLPPVVALSALGHDATAVALPVRGGSPWFWAALFTHPESRIASLADLPGAKAAWVNPESASGYLVMRAALRADGVDPDRCFAAETFHETHAAMSRAVLASRDTVGATYLHLDDDDTITQAGWGHEPVRLLRRAGPIPGDVLAASNTLSEPLRHTLTDALVRDPGEALEQASRELFAAERFVEPEQAHRAHLEALGRYLLRERVR